ncbi:MAG: ABC transporter permease [Lachnospiraceae bacterium]|nr:ABC transporter permease [Lachnospiraceae bacterium]
MIRYLIKNNFKLMSRSIINILLLIVMPLILIAVLSSAFNDLMKKYDAGDFAAGYRVVGDAMPDAAQKSLKEAAEENGILLREYPQGAPEEILKNEELSAFVVFDDGEYTVYEDGDAPEEGKILEYFVNAFYENMAAYAVGIDPATVSIRMEHPSFKPAIDSLDYYGIVEVVYFVWCAIVCGAGIFISEKKNHIEKKYLVSNLSLTQQYLGKLVPLVCTVGAGSAISAVLSVVLFGVRWGNPFVSGLIVFLSTAAASAFGLMVYYISDSVVATIIVVFTIVWIAGFFGGSFETYIFSSHPESVKFASPIYHVNRALTELSCMGHSDYVKSAVIYTLLLTVGCSVIAVMAGALRKRGKA